MIQQSCDEPTIKPLKVSGEPLLYHQIIQLRKFGINRFIVAVEKIDSMALHIATILRRKGIEIEFISRLAALSDILGADDSFLMISDGVWSNDTHIENIIHAISQEILVFENDDSLSIFERIDLNYRWSGLAKLKANILSSIDNLPEDAAIQSTLLRLALQNHSTLKVIEYSSSSLIRVTDQSMANNLSEAQIKTAQVAMNIRGFFEIILFYPLVQFILFYFWREEEFRPSTEYIIQYAHIILFILAIIFASFEFTILSYMLAVISYFCWFFRGFQNNIKANNEGKWGYRMSNMCIFIILFITAYQEQNLWSVGAAILLFLLGYSAKILKFEPIYDRLALSFCDIFFLMIAATIFNIQSYAMLVISIVYALWIFGGTFMINANNSKVLEK